MAITASMVKQLRERTGAGMMECKNALAEVGGDMEGAVEVLRTRGAAKADKKADRIAAEGMVSAALGDDGAIGVLVEVNCETDFVAKDEHFQSYVKDIGRTLLAEQPADLEALRGLTVAGGSQSVEDARIELISKIGENVSLRRFEYLLATADSPLSAYVHGTRIAVLAAVEGGRSDLGRDVAMQIAASHPLYIARDAIPQSALDKEKEILAAQARTEGKPPQIIEKMIVGRLQKYIDEITLLGQPFVKDPDQTVDDLMKSEQARVVGFRRMELGEGLERRSDDFVAQVMAQAGTTAGAPAKGG